MSYDSVQLAVVSVTDKEFGDSLVWVESKEITISWFVLLRNTAENDPRQPSSTQLRWKWQRLNKAAIVLKSTKPRFHLLWHLFPAAMHQGSGYSDLTRDTEFKLDFTLWWLHYTMNPSNGGLAMAIGSSVRPMSSGNTWRSAQWGQWQTTVYTGGTELSYSHLYVKVPTAVVPTSC